MDILHYETPRLRRLALLISGLYTLCAVLWQWGQTIGLDENSPREFLEMRFALDAAFLLITGAVMYYILLRTMRRIHHSERALRAERALRQRDEYLRSVVAHSPLAIITVDANGKVHSWNHAAEELYGWDEVETHLFAEPEVPSEQREEARLIRERVFRGERFTDLEARRIRKDGTPIDVTLSIAPLYNTNGNIIRAISFSADITERKRQAEQVQHLATHDSLTNLPNRRILEEYLQRLADRAKRGQPASLLMLDLDSFKLVNDSLGHMMGDQFLVQIARVLESTLRAGDLLVRFGGDEFALLIEHVKPAQAKVIAERIRQCVSEFRFVYGGHTFDTTVSIGIAPVLAKVDAREIMVMADRALMLAKDGGRNRVVVYDPASETSSRLADASRWATRIKDALRENSFVLHFQPVVRLADDKPEHYEALLRMQDKDGKLISPGAFIGAAERFGLMPQIDHWVIQQVLKMLQQRPDLRIFVNLSGSSLADENLLSEIERKLREFDEVKSRLVFEITETVAVRDLNRAQQWMTTLMELGCEFALDDFGVAFSSFSYLRALPVSYVKIDGSFIRNLPFDTCNQAMVQALVTVAHALDKKVVAEWVETASAKEILRAIGAEYGQGYLWGQPQNEIRKPALPLINAAA